MTIEKRVDESWKDAVSQEKIRLVSPGDPASHPGATAAEPSGTSPQKKARASDPRFLNHVTSLAIQGMIFMGEVPHPLTGEIEKNLEQSKFMIDTLGMIREKTQGNLSEEEENTLNASLYELQLKYVEVSQKEKAA